jgi:hypothetical protein
MKNFNDAVLSSTAKQNEQIEYATEIKGSCNGVNGVWADWDEHIMTIYANPKGGVNMNMSLHTLNHLLDRLQFDNMPVTRIPYTIFENKKVYDIGVRFNYDLKDPAYYHINNLAESEIPVLYQNGEKLEHSGYRMFKWK